MRRPVARKQSKRGEATSPTACHAVGDLHGHPDLNAMRSNAVRGKRDIEVSSACEVSSAGALLRACRPLIAFTLVAAPIALLPVAPAAAQPGPGERVGYAAALV